MNAVPPRARPLGSGTSSFLPVSSVILLSLFVIPKDDAGCGEHQHPIERVHDLLQSLHWNSPLCELRKTLRIHLGRAEPPERMCTLFFTFQIDHGERGDSHLSFFPSIYIRCKKCPHIAIEAC